MLTRLDLKLFTIKTVKHKIFLLQPGQTGEIILNISLSEDLKFLCKFVSPGIVVSEGEGREEGGE